LDKKRGKVWTIGFRRYKGKMVGVGRLVVFCCLPSNLLGLFSSYRFCKRPSESSLFLTSPIDGLPLSPLFGFAPRGIAVSTRESPMMAQGLC
jgi:hypothetical protein